jgi:hypothetical protein
MTGLLLAVSDLKVDTSSFLVIVSTAALAATLAALAGCATCSSRSWSSSSCSGSMVGPQVLDLAQVNDFTDFFSSLGLGMLFFFAGYEIDIAASPGLPLRLALGGWAFSLVIAYTLGGILAALGVVVSLVYVGSALATTAIGTLIPVLSDTVS